jgi:predicted nucleotidyltransferase
MTDFHRLLNLLAEHEVEFIIIGGVAAVVHGSSRLTQDLDIVYHRTSKNLERLAAALQGTSPYLRGAPPGLPFEWSAATLSAGLNFTLETSLGQIDLLGTIAGGSQYDSLIEQTIEIEVFDVRCRCLSLDALIQAKRAAGRPKDFEAIAELEAILEEQHVRKD